MKKYLLIPVLTGIGIVSLLFVLFLFVLWPFRGIGGKTDYSMAKTKCIEIFENRKEKFFSAKNSIIDNGTTEGVKIKKVESLSYNQYDATKIIEFHIGSQGMLGGQYWGIYYISDDMPIIDTLDSYDLLTDGPYGGSYYYQKPNGNDFYATERIEENWYFFYMDYDGNRHGLDWGIS